MVAKRRLDKFFAIPEVSFGVDPDTSGATYKHIKVLPDVTFQPTVEVVERPGETGDMTRNPHVPGVRGATMQAKLEMKASGTPAASTVAAIASESSPFLEACLGTVVRGTGTTVGAASGNGASGTPMVVASAAGLARYMMIEVGGEVRFITSISGTNIVLDRALSSNPSNGTIVYASSLFKRATTGHKSMALVCYIDGIEYTLLGCKVHAQLEGINAKGTALVSLSIEAADYARTSKGSLPDSNLAGITAVKAPVVKGAPFAIDGVTRRIVGLDLDLGMNIVFEESTEHTNAKSAIHAVESMPKGTIRPYYNVAHMEDLEAGTERAIGFSCGDRTNGWGFYAAKAQWGQPSLQNVNGMMGEEVPFFINDNGSDAELVVCQF